MFINAYMLRDNSTLSLKSRLLSNRLDRYLSFIAFYSPETLVEEHGIYITTEENAASFPPNSRKCCLIINGRPPEALLRSNIDILYLNPPINFSDLFNQISSTAADLLQFEESLYKCFNNENPIQAMLDFCQPYFRNPVAVYTTYFQILCFSERKKDAALMLFHPEDTLAFAPDEEVDSLTTHPKFVESLKYKLPMIFPSDLTGYRMLYQNVKQDGENIARVLSLETESAICDGDYPLIMILGTFVANALNKSYTSTFLTRHTGITNYVESLLNGTYTPELVCNDALEKYSWHPEDTFMVYCIDSYRDVAMGSLASTCARLESLIPHSLTIMLCNKIVFIANLSACNLSRNDVESKCVYLLREIIMKAGISTEFKGILNLRDFYKQAEYALEIGNKVDPQIWSYHFEKYRMTYFIHSATQNLSWQTLCDPGLLRLIEYDKKKGRNYCTTLRTYLENNMNATEATKQLYMHRQSFLYQLNNIEKILDVDLKNKDNRLSLLLSFQLLDFVENSSNNLL